MSDPPPPVTGRVLVVDDEQSLRQMMHVLLQRAGHQVSLAADVEHARQLIAESAVPFDVVVTDLVMPDGSGLEVIDLARARSNETQVIVVTAHASVETAVEAMQRGAYGYLEKPLRAAQVRAQIDKALEKRMLLHDNASLRLRSRSRQVEGATIIGRSAALENALDITRRAAPARASVLITGESGTGKELIARLIHTYSDRKDAPFIVVNCGAIPETLLESELFGHEKGAFTGAVSKREGLFRQADKATLFLDEVGELPLALQVKLLRALQDRKIRPVGADAEITVDVRVIAATNRDLEADTRAGRFRQDLYYRLNVLRIRLPALRERREDIALLLEHFRNRFATELGRPLISFSPESLKVLLAYDYPGNIRELENIVERAVTLARGAQIVPSDLPPEVCPTAPTSQMALLPEAGMDLEAFLADVERSILQQALARADGVRTRAAGLVGLSFRSLRYRLSKLGLSGDRISDEPDPPDSHEG